MLIQLIAQQPQMLGPIIANTPPWVWALLAGLLTLGFSQVVSRTVRLRRVTFTSIAMTAFIASTTVTA